MARFEEYKDIFVFVEQENGNIAEVSYELISEARKLVASIPEFGYKVVGVLLGENVKEKAQEVISHGADKVIVVDDALLKDYSTQFYADALLNQEDAWLYLDSFLFQSLGHHFSRKYMEELCAQLKENVLIEIENHLLERHNNKLYFMPSPKDVYYTLNELEYKDYKEYSIMKQGQTIEFFSVEASDFPLVVRHVKVNDVISMRFGNKNVHRFFVDRKICKIYRKYWLVVENNAGKVIFVPGLGCDVEHYSQNQQFYFKMNGLD